MPARAGAGSLRVLRTDALLLLTAAIWGFAFVAQRLGNQHVGPFTYNGVRFALGALSLLPLIALQGRGGGARPGPASPPRSGPSLPAAGLIAGVILFLAANLQQLGMVETGAGKAGFITGLYVVLVPLSGLLWGQRAGWAHWAGVALALAGLYLLSVTGRFTIARGDLLVLLSAVCWTAHVQVLGWLSPRVDPIRLSALQFAFCSLASLAVAFATETVEAAGLRQALAPILYGGIGSVGVAYTLQVVAQRTAHPAHAAILLSTESVFAVLGGALLLAERLSPRGLLGCALMLAGMLLSQLSLIRKPSIRKSEIRSSSTRRSS